MREYIDNLTGLNNMLYLFENYSNYIEKYENTYTILIDFQKLKYINDNFGHSAGDTCIITFARIIKEIFKESLLIRISGDEFIIITSLELNEITSRIIQVIDEIEKAFKRGIIPIAFKFNCGIKKSDIDLKETLFKADITMYYAKNNNKIIEYYREEFLTNIKDREQFIKKIDNLIKNKEFIYRYQAIHDISGENIVIKEIHTRDNQGESIFADKKFDILITNYRLKKIDMINLEKMLESKIIEKENYFINIHYQTIISQEYNFTSVLGQLIKKFNINPEQLYLSINVLNYGDSIKRLAQVLMELKALGIKICLEGLSFDEKQCIIPIISIVKIDYIKIYKEILIKGINEKYFNIFLRHIINLFLALNIIPIFMSVETESEVDFIKQIDPRCLIKGYVYSQEKDLDI